MKELKARKGVEKKETDPMIVLESNYVETLLEDLNAHIRVVGGVGLTDETMKLGIEELAGYLFPNGIELRIHNRRLVSDPLREE